MKVSWSARYIPDAKSASISASDSEPSSDPGRQHRDLAFEHRAEVVDLRRSGLGNETRL